MVPGEERGRMKGHTLSALTRSVSRRIGKGVWTFFRKGEWPSAWLVGERKSVN